MLSWPKDTWPEFFLFKYYNKKGMYLDHIFELVHLLRAFISCFIAVYYDDIHPFMIDPTNSLSLHNVFRYNTLLVRKWESAVM